jgi:hypothetical protein
VRSRSTCQRMAGSPSSSQSITLMTAGYPTVDPAGGCDARTGLRVVTGMLAIANGPPVEAPGKRPIVGS